jgi:hypothetical protein
VDVETISASAQRPASELTRRDLARALLTVPASRALAGLPTLRRELVAAGVPLSARFWEHTEELLTAIDGRAATNGDVQRWLEATGTEPTQFVAGGFLWPEEAERGPVATEMHARLVAHLEDLVAAGAIDPDRLLAGDETALDEYVRVQTAWLSTPLEDGREPIWAVTDEEDEEFLAAWDEAEADAASYLRERLDACRPRPRPDEALRAAAIRLREELSGVGDRAELLRAVGGVDPSALPDDDEELWLALATGVVTGGHVPIDDGPVTMEGHAAWMALQHADWIGAVVRVAELGPGAAADAHALAHHAVTFDAGDEALDGGPDVDLADEELALSLGFHTVARLWRALGAVDEDERLTELGWWGVPAALFRAWASADRTSA